MAIISSRVPQLEFLSCLEIWYTCTSLKFLDDLHKKISKINLAIAIGMAQCINALADKVQNKECHAHSDMATLFNNHPVAVAHQLALNLLLLM